MGKFAFGHADEYELFVATKDGLAQIWYADANGVVTGNTPSADNVASAIIDSYNEHFGTDIYIWTPETKTLQVGGTVPNWNAYEKIEMLSTKVAVELENNNYFYGYIKGDTFFVSSMDSYAVSVNNNGIVLDTQEFPVEVVYMVVSGSLQRAGFNVSSASPNEVIVDVDEQIENWNDYQIIPREA